MVEDECLTRVTKACAYKNLNFDRNVLNMKGTTVVYHPDISYYDFGEGHPVRGDRFPQYLKLLKSKGLFEDGTLSLVEPEAATEEDSRSSTQPTTSPR